MPYLVEGNAEQIFQAFGQDWIVKEKADDTEIMYSDVPRTDFLGTEAQAREHFNLWYQRTRGQYYLQGNISAGNLRYVLGAKPLMAEGEDPEVYHRNFRCQHFAYMNDSGGESCGFMVAYRKDDPSKWIIGLAKKGYAAPKDRKLVFLSSVDLAAFIKSPHPDVNVSSVALLDNPLMQQIDSALLKQLIPNAFHPEQGEINLRFQRIQLLMRHLQVEQDKAKLQEPLLFKQLNLPALFADNRALDLIFQYDLLSALPFALQLSLLSDSDELRKEIEALQLTNDEKLNKSLLKMLICFYKEGTLAANKHLLRNLNLVKKFSDLIVKEEQIRLLPFFVYKKYSDNLIQQIVSNPAYLNAIDKLVKLEPALAQDVPKFFKKPKKLEDLEFIHQLADEDCKMLCLIFWAKGNLSTDGYQELAHMAEQYPLMASTLVYLDQTKTFSIKELRQIAKNPKQHIKESICYHFANELKAYPQARSDLEKLDTQKLEAVSNALILLKNSGIENSNHYYQVLARDKKGQLLRLFLSQLTKIDDKEHRKLLIDILYAGINHGIQTQGKEVLAVKKNPEQFALAKDLHERFMCATQMQDLKFKQAMVQLAAKEDNEEAKRFRQVILRVEVQCKKIYERLSGAVSYQETLNKWQREEEIYRKSLYLIAYENLMNPSEDLRSRLDAATATVLNIVDPPVESHLQQALILIANIVISVLTLTLANEIKYRYTGNYWFFTQTRSGEELRALDKDIFQSIELSP